LLVSQNNLINPIMIESQSKLNWLI
jgi:hypothetical protein